MNKRYVYPKWRIIYPYCIILLVPAMMFYVLLVAGTHDLSGIVRGPALVISLLYCVFALSLFVPTLLWILNGLKTVIVLDDAGIYKKDMFREVRFRWHEIVRVDKKYLYRGDYPFYTPNTPPQDLLIQGKDERKIKVFKALRSVDSEGEGISDFERELFQRIDTDKQPRAERQRREIRHQIKSSAFFLLGGGVLVLIAGICFHDIRLILGGPVVCICGLFLLIEPSKATTKKEPSTPPDPELIKRTPDNSTAAERGEFKPVSSTATGPKTGKAGSGAGRKMAAVLNAVINIFIIGFVYMELGGPRILAHVIAALLVIESAIFSLYAVKFKQKKKSQPLIDPVDPE